MDTFNECDGMANYLNYLVSIPVWSIAMKHVAMVCFGFVSKQVSFLQKCLPAGLACRLLLHVI